MGARGVPVQGGAVRSGDWWRLSSGQQETLKVLAVLTMVVDHVGVAFLGGSSYEFARGVGRLALPLFAFLLAYNIMHRDVSPRRYYGPLALLLVLSQLPYALFSEWGAAGRWNIFAELFGGALLIDSLFGRAQGFGPAQGSEPVRVYEPTQEFRPARVLERLLLAAVGLASASMGAYGLAGGALVAAWAVSLRFPGPWSLLLVAALLLAVNWGSPRMPVPLLLLALLPLLARVPIRLRRMPRWFWYGFYPGHLLIIVGLQSLLVST